MPSPDASGLPLTVYWRYHVPAPGYAVGALAVVAGIMSMRDIKILGKIIWAVLLVCLLITEFRAIDKDRADNEQKQKEFFEIQKKGFSEIATQVSQNFAATTKGLTTAINQSNGLLRTTQGVADLARRNLEIVTGGNSFGYVIPRYSRGFADIIPQTELPQALPIVLMNGGTEHLSGVTVSIYRFVVKRPIEGSSKSLEALTVPILQPTIMGTLPPKGRLTLLSQLDPNPDANGEPASYIINVSAQNGSAGEVLDIRKSKDGKDWEYKLRVWRNVVGPREKGDFHGPDGWQRMVKTTDWIPGGVSPITPPQ
jgi:hypothetical protein